MSKLVVANFKMNPDSARRAVRLARSYDEKNVVIAPPFVFLDAVGKVLKKASLGAQDVFFKNDGPWTGEISLRQLKDLKVGYVIVGHSERRKLGETDEIVGQKVAAALKHGLKVILCVGEGWAVRKKGKRAAYDFVKKQLIKDLSGVKSSKSRVSNLIVAYEPIWAIGTGKNDDSKDAAEMAFFIKGLLTTHYSLQAAKVLYGGSVTARSAAGFLGRPEVDGILVGGASLRPADFRHIVRGVKR